MTRNIITEKTRIYIQLQPDTHTVNMLNNTRRFIEDGRPVPDEELHMTIIHIGEMSRLVSALPKIPLQKILCGVALYSKQVIDITTRYSNTAFELTPTSLQTFGKTVALAYQPSKELIKLHAEVLHALMGMLKSIGIPSPRAFMEKDANLRYALTLNPHVALAKHASTYDRHAFTDPGCFSLMKVVYS